MLPSCVPSIQDAFIPQDRESGRSRGFAFVTMADPAAAQNAISQLNEQDFNVSAGDRVPTASTPTCQTGHTYCTSSLITIATTISVRGAHATVCPALLDQLVLPQPRC